MRNTAIATALAAAAMLTACSESGYDTGDGSLSYLTAELALLHTNHDKQVTRATLDDGTTLDMANAFATKWAATPDSVYRALLYYDAAADGQTTVRARSVLQVPVLRMTEADKVGTMHTDPVGVESVWTAKNGTYINMSLLLKAGKADADDAVQTIGLVSHGTTTDADGKRTLHLTLYHDQGNVPQYYTVQRYASIDMGDTDGADIVELTANTYDGNKVLNIQRDGND